MGDKYKVWPRTQSPRPLAIVISIRCRSEVPDVHSWLTHCCVVVLLLYCCIAVLFYYATKVESNGSSVAPAPATTKKLTGSAGLVQDLSNKLAKQRKQLNELVAQNAAKKSTWRWYVDGPMPARQSSSP
eukprot:SAG31_NODE_21798_length_540_cov_1.623583_1_plen_128_part_01